METDTETEPRRRPERADWIGSVERVTGLEPSQMRVRINPTLARDIEVGLARIHGEHIEGSNATILPARCRIARRDHHAAEVERRRIQIEQLRDVTAADVRRIWTAAVDRIDSSRDSAL